MAIEIPPDVDSCDIKYGTKKVTLTNLKKIFWPNSGKTKRDLLLYYVAISPALLPHSTDRLPARVEQFGDLFKPVLRQRSRCRLESLT